MNFEDNGIILDARGHGETHAIAEIFTASRGRWAGLVYGGQGRKMRPLLQPGNEVNLEWKGRGEDSLGNFALELSEARAGAAMGDRFALSGLSATCATALACLPEREAHGPAFQAMAVLLANIEHIDLWPPLMARWELGLLAELGFGLTLDRCAATGSRSDLIYVSPKSACAVSREAGAAYADKLLPLPDFLKGGGGEPTEDQAFEALYTTGYFIETRILHPAGKQLPEARRRITELLKNRGE